MKVISIVATGGPEQLSIQDRNMPHPKEGQVLITVAAVGIGFVDVMMRTGNYPGVDSVGLVPGAEIAGMVSAVGTNVPVDLVGQWVYALCGTGGCAEVVCVDANAIIPLPEGLSAEAAVATGINALVAWFALKRANVAAGDAVLVRGASGGIGTMAVQLAVASGATCTAASSKPERLAYLGAQALVDRSGGTGTFDIVIDPVAGSETGSFFRKLNPNGRIILCGAAAGLPSPDFTTEILATFFTSPTLFMLSLNSVPPHEVSAAIRSIFAMVTDGRLIPVVDRRVSFDEIVEAHSALESGEIVGKVIVIL